VTDALQTARQREGEIMFRTIAIRALLGAALVVTVPTVATAQADQPTPEGTIWNLVSYAADGELTQVPWYVDATLVLDEGQAFGSAGCNGFGASYELDGDSLAFSKPGHTDVGCSKAVLRVENGYMAALPTTVRWARDTGAGPGDVILYLFDEQGDIILSFMPPATSLTSADIYRLQTQLDKMRDRIKELEAQVEQLKKG
jgi:heat shock protein HslJ